MDTRELRGDMLAKAALEEVRNSVQELRSQGVSPRMAAVLTDSDPATLSYVESKSKVAKDLDITFDLIVLNNDETQEDLEKTLKKLADEPSMHGIILELPLANRFDFNKAIDHIPFHKDIDGLTARNLGLLYMRRESEALLAATPQACVLLAETILGEQGRNLSGARVGMVGKGRTVGTPLIGMLFNRHATLTVCHSQTVDVADALRGCEIVFVGVGKAGLINKDNIQPGQILIDAGISTQNGKLAGDVDMESVRGVAGAVTPVLHGVGSLTTAFIFKNLIRAIQFQL